MTTPPEMPPRGYTTADVAAMAEPPRKQGFFRRHWGKLSLAALVLVPLAAFFIWSAIGFAVTYSSGERVGYVRKFSKKGWLCKTWEGEIAMSNQPGQAPDRFQFTVRDDSIASRIVAAEGRQVAIRYAQHPWLPGTCWGETEYFVEGVRDIAP
jgi:hypothetical protein